MSEQDKAEAVVPPVESAIDSAEVKAVTILKDGDPEVPQDGIRLVEDKNRSLKLAVAKLCVKDGDILIVRVPNGCDRELMRALYVQARGFLRAEGLLKVRLLVLETGIGFESLNTEMMETYGWIRKK